MVEKWERADVGGLLASQDQNQGDIWAWAAARVMSGSVAQLQPDSMFIDPDVIKGHADARGLGYHLGPCWCLRTMLLWGPCQSEWPMLLPEALVTPEPKLLLKTMSGFCDPITAGFCVDVRGPWYY